MSPEAYAKLMGGIWGFLIGAGVSMLVGFQWGGWSTSTASQKLSDEAVLTSRAAICVAQFMHAPNHNLKIKEFKATESYKKTELIETGGWDKMPGEDKAAWGVASACVVGLEAAIKTGA